MKWRILVISVFIGILIALIFKLFEFVVNQGSNYIWNDLLKTNEVRWLVIPTAIVLSILFSIVLKWLKQPRWVEPVTDMLAEKPEPKEKPSVKQIGSTLGQGVSSLLAGASLGPEMSLTESSEQIGKWAAYKLKVDKETGGVLVASSVGALMVVFLGSPAMALLPFLIIFQKAKKIPLASIAPVLLTTLSAYGVLWLLDHSTKGYGSIPVELQTSGNDYLGVIIVALCVSVAAFLLIKSIHTLSVFAKWIDRHMHWILSAALFGLILGGLYFLGGQSIEFSGSAGTELLVDSSNSYGTWALLGLVGLKLLATAWSKAAGYRGGLVFPSIYIGIAMGLFVGSLFGAFEGPGVIIGAIAAMFVSLTKSALLALLILAALLPIQLLPLAILAIAAAFVGNKILKKLLPSWS